MAIGRKPNATVIQGVEQALQQLEKHMDSRFEQMEKHMNSRFEEIHRILLQLQSDLSQFYFKLGQHESRLDNLEGK